MPTVHYQNHSIPYTFERKNGLKYHYISVKKDKGVVLRGRAISEDRANQIILEKAPWILKKLAAMAEIEDTEMGEGTLMSFLGEKYPIKLDMNEAVSRLELRFVEEVFEVSLREAWLTQENLQGLFDAFYRAKAKQLITPRIRAWSAQTGLPFNDLRFKKMKTRWGSCSGRNNINLNIYAIKLSWQMIDYLIVHELSHTKVKNHSKDFYAEVARHMPDWKEWDRKLRKQGL